jgi:hypothetical protein
MSKAESLINECKNNKRNIVKLLSALNCFTIVYADNIYKSSLLTFCLLNCYIKTSLLNIIIVIGQTLFCQTLVY